MSPPFGCGCSPLCDACIEEHVQWWRGVCQCRGEAWARAIAAVIPIDRPWPRTERMRAIARRKVDDLTTDGRLAELLVVDVVLGAERWWNRALERTG